MRNQARNCDGILNEVGVLSRSPKSRNSLKVEGTKSVVTFCGYVVVMVRRGCTLS